MTTVKDLTNEQLTAIKAKAQANDATHERFLRAFFKNVMGKESTPTFDSLVWDVSAFVDTELGEREFEEFLALKTDTLPARRPQ